MSQSFVPTVSSLRWVLDLEAIVLFLLYFCFAVSQRSDQGHSIDDDIHPPLCQLPGFCPDVSYQMITILLCQLQDPQVHQVFWNTNIYVCFRCVASYFHASPFHTLHHVFRLFAVICPLTARYYFPRQLLIPHFWTPAQQVAFRGAYHSVRAEHHLPVLQGMQKTSSKVKDRQLQSCLKDLCAKVSQSIFLFSITVFLNSLSCFMEDDTLIRQEMSYVFMPMRFKTWSTCIAALSSVIF